MSLDYSLQAQPTESCCYFVSKRERERAVRRRATNEGLEGKILWMVKRSRYVYPWCPNIGNEPMGGSLRVGDPNSK